MIAIPLHGPLARGRTALIDDADLGLIEGYRWNVSEYRAGMTHQHGPYARAAIPGSRKHVYMHQLITGWPATDHLNRNGLDNRRANLRRATKTQNAGNSPHRPGSSSRFKGVCRPAGRTKFMAQIRDNGRNVYLGVFESEMDAALAYDVAAREIFGEFAYLNIPAAEDVTS